MLDQPFMTDIIEASSISHMPQLIDIYSASWGPTDNGKTVDGPRELTLQAMADGVNKVKSFLPPCPGPTLDGGHRRWRKGDDRGGKGDDGRVRVRSMSVTLCISSASARTDPKVVLGMQIFERDTCEGRRGGDQRRLGTPLDADSDAGLVPEKEGPTLPWCLQEES